MGCGEDKRASRIAIEQNAKLTQNTCFRLQCRNPAMSAESSRERGMFMRKFNSMVFGAMAMALCGAASAQHVVAMTVGSEPMREMVNKPIWVCGQAQAQTQAQDHGDQPQWGAAILGSVAGGALGSTVGSGDGRKAAIALGAGLGAMAADRAARPQRQQQQAPSACQWVDNYVPGRATGYKVVYDIDGASYEGFSRQPVSGGTLVQVDLRTVRPLAQ